MVHMKSSEDLIILKFKIFICLHHDQFDYTFKSIVVEVNKIRC